MADDEHHCKFVRKCPMFGEFSSRATLRIFQIHYCYGDYGRCERYKRATRGFMPPADLLPDGTLLRPRAQTGKE